MSNEAKVGVLVIAAMTIFVGTFLSVATIQLGGTKVEYRTYFKFAGGVETGDLVRYGGRKAGVVRRISSAADDPTTTEIILDMREDVPVNERSIAKISSLSALGDNYIEVTPGENSAARIPPGGVIASEEAISFSDITAKVVEVTDNANVLMTELKGDISLLIGDLRDLTANLQELTGEDNQRNIHDLLANANQLVEEQGPKFDRITSQISELIEHVDATVTDLRKVAQTADDTVANVNRTVDETREPIKKDLEELEATLVEARRMLEDIRSVVAVNGVNIDETLQNFRATSENLEQFSDELKQRPWSLIRTKAKPDRQVPPTGGQ